MVDELLALDSLASGDVAAADSCGCEIARPSHHTVVVQCLVNLSAAILFLIAALV